MRTDNNSEVIVVKATPVIKLKRFHPNAKVKIGHKEDAGLDVFVVENTKLAPGETKAIPLGIGVELTGTLTGFIMPRTSLAKRGIIVHSCPIDPGYTGEVHAILTNTTQQEFIFDTTAAIGQLVIWRCTMPNDYMVGDQEVPCERGTSLRFNGWAGSTNAEA